MNLKNYIIEAYINNKILKKKNRISIIIIVISSILIGLSSSVVSMINTQISDLVYNSPSGCTLTFNIEYKSYYDELVKIYDDDDRVAYLGPVYTVNLGAQFEKELCGKKSIKVDLYHKIYAYYSDVDINDLDDDEIILPRYIFSGEFDSTNMFADIDYADTEQYIGQNITLKFMETQAYKENRLNIKDGLSEEEFDPTKCTYVTKTYKVVGVYDNIKCTDFDGAILLNENEIINIMKISEETQYDDTTTAITMIANGSDALYELAEEVKLEPIMKIGSTALLLKNMAIMLMAAGYVVLVVGISNVILNTYKDIKSRNKEIGLLIAVGYTHTNINIIELFQLFIVYIKAMFIQAIITIAMIITYNWLVEGQFSILYKSMVLSYNITNLIVILSATFIGMLVAYIVAVKRTMSINPIDALRSE